MVVGWGADLALMQVRYNAAHDVLSCPTLANWLQAGVLSSQTTNYSRTRATLAGVLTGLYPGTRDAIDVVTAPEMDEILYANVRNCQRLKALVNELHTIRKGAVVVGHVRHAAFEAWPRNEAMDTR